MIVEKLNQYHKEWVIILYIYIVTVDEETILYNMV